MLLTKDVGLSDLHSQSANVRLIIQDEASQGVLKDVRALRHTAHVVAAAAQQRAAMARILFASGQHAEVYTDPHELVDHRPSSGIVLVHESDCFGVVEVCSALAAHGFWLPVIGFGEEIDADRIIAGMKAGALNYIVGHASAGVVLKKMDECAREASVLEVAHRQRVEAKSRIAKLSDRERQVLDLLASGLSNKAIARDLGISPRTVEIHRMKMMGKLGASSSADAIRIQVDANR